MYEVAKLVQEINAAGFEARPYKNGLEVRLPGTWQRMTVTQATEFLRNLRNLD